MRLEWKALPAEFKADLGKREVTGYASTFGNVDHVGDRVLSGAYTKTLRDDMPLGRIKVKRNHEALIGKPIHAEEDSKGLLTVSRISKTELGDETLVLITDAVIDRMSIGYRAEEKGYVTENGQKIRELKSVALREWSFLDDPPANDNAIVTAVKSLDDVMCAFDQMQSALYSLRNLSRTPPDVLARLAAFMTDIDSITEAAAVADGQQELAGIAATLKDLQSYLTSPARSA